MNAPLWKRFASTALAETEAAQADKAKAVVYLRTAIASLQRAVQLLESEREA